MGREINGERRARLRDIVKKSGYPDEGGVEQHQV